MTGKPVDCHHPDRGAAQPGRRRDLVPHPAAGPRAGHEHPQAVRPGHQPDARQPGVLEQRLDPVEVDAVAEHLGLPVQPADHLDQPGLGDPGEVAGVQLADLGTAGEVGERLGVPHHHVRTRVDELAAAGLARSGTGASRNEPPGTGTPIVSGWSSASSGGR